MEGQTNALELAISKKACINQKLFQSQHPPVIHSSMVRDDKQIEFRQAQAGNFDLAIRYQKSLKAQMEMEKERHLENCEGKLSDQRQVRA